MRVYHVLALGCIPVITQHDGDHPPVAQAFEPEALLWEDFAVVVRRDQIDSLPAVLAAVDVHAKRAALRRVWTRMVWRNTLPRRQSRSLLPGPDAFETLIGALGQRAYGTGNRSQWPPV